MGSHFAGIFGWLFIPAALMAAPALYVDAGASRHPISQWIYGINTWKDNGLQKAMHIPLVRWGGDTATTFNWQTGVKNNTGDNPWLYENYAVNPNFDAFHENNLRTGSATLSTVSLMDWTPAKPGACSFSVAKYGAQKTTNPDNPDCGNGILANGTAVVNDPKDAYLPVTEAFSQQWVQHLVQNFGPSAAGGVRFWSLDNEPEWWDTNHADIYRQPASYDEMVARDVRWAIAVKAVDASALITGPVPSGWPGMLFSKKDMMSGWSKSPYQYWDNPVDQKAHSGIPWIGWYLQQMRLAEAQIGRRLLDVLDVHAYITPSNLSGSAGDANMEALRMTSTRALWDANYIVPNGNIYDVAGRPVAPRLVPQLRDWVNTNYPGTMTGITEYNWGALDTITGAIAQADILGIFGRESLDLATLWGEPSTGDPGAFAFKMFLNYDGMGGQFGETSVGASTTDADSLSIFAAQRLDSALTVLVLNKTASDLNAAVNLANFAPDGTAQVWQYGKANLNAIVRKPDLTVAGNAVAATFPAYSMTLFVIPQSQNAMSVPRPFVASVTSAASYDASGVAPGEIVALFGQGFGSSTASTRVLFNGIPAPLIYVFDRQAGAVVPYAAGQSNSANVIVENQGNASLGFTVPVLASHPGIFTLNTSGIGQGSVVNVTRPGINGPSNPAARGEYISVYATGEGLTFPPGVDGKLSIGALPAPMLKCSATVGGQAAFVQYCGAAPFEITGLLQVNVLIPGTVAAGSAVPVAITIGASTSQNNVTVAIQ